MDILEAVLTEVYGACASEYIQRAIENKTIDALYDIANIKLEEEKEKMYV